MQPVRNTVTSYLGIMALVVFMATASGFGLLYSIDVRLQQDHLLVLATSYSRLLENFAKDKKLGDSDIVRLVQGAPIALPHSSIGLELVLARREQDKIVFLYRQKSPEAGSPATIDWSAKEGEPMRRALEGKKGVITGVDYRGVSVLAAHYPIFQGRWGLVVKIDQTEIRSHYIQAAFFAFMMMLVFLLAGSWWLRHISKPWFVRVLDNETKYRTLFEKGRDSIFLFGVDKGGLPDRFLEVNEAACRSLGYTQQELQRMKPQDLAAPGLEGTIKTEMTSILGNKQHRFESEMKAKDGRTFPVEFRAVLFKLFDRQMVLAVARDMEDWKNAEKKIRDLVLELKGKNQKLLELDRVKDDFISTISHELRTPLTSILGYLRLLNREVGGKLGSDQRDYIETSLRNGERLYDLINELLDLSRLESGRMELHLKDVQVEPVLKEAIQTTQNLFTLRHVVINTKLPPLDLVVSADEEKLFRVLVNLLGNAAKFTPERGHVEVGAVRHVRNGRSGCLFWVRDDGAGIPQEDINRIFDKFYRLEAHLKRETGGSGLGLAISLKLVELHGGEIWAENVEGGGAIFKVFLPEVIERDLE